MTTYPIRIYVRDNDAKGLLTNTVTSHDRFSLVTERTGPLGGICIFELGDDREKDMMLIRRMLYTGQVHEVLVTSNQKDPDTLIAAMQAGVAEFLPCPPSADDIDAAFTRFLSRYDGHSTMQPPSQTQQAAPGKSRIIHILGGKGGVGATTVAVNLAVEIAKSSPDSQTALVDMRVPLGEVPLFLDLEYTSTWGDAVRDISRLDATFAQSLMSCHDSGLHVLPAPSRPEEMESASQSAMGLLFEELRGAYGTVIIDGSPYLDEAGIAAMEHADDIILVCVLSLPCLAGIRKLLETFNSMSPGLTDKVHLVVNRHLSKAEISIREAEELLGRKVFWLIENDYEATLSAINQGRPLADAAPTSSVTRAIAKLSRKLGGPAAPPTAKKKGILSRLFSRPDAPLRSVIEPAGSES